MLVYIICCHGNSSQPHHWALSVGYTEKPMAALRMSANWPQTNRNACYRPWRQDKIILHSHHDSVYKGFESLPYLEHSYTDKLSTKENYKHCTACNFPAKVLMRTEYTSQNPITQISCDLVQFHTLILWPVTSAPSPNWLKMEQENGYPYSTGATLLAPTKTNQLL